MTALADVGDEAQVQAMFAAGVREFGTIDILVSNAGHGAECAVPGHERGAMGRRDAREPARRLSVRPRGRPRVLRRGVRADVSVAAGKIIFISSVHEVIPWAGHVNYAASKGGLMLLMKSLAQEVAEKRIRVNSIAPGAIRTPINTAAWGTPAAYADLLEAGAVQADRRGGRHRQRRGGLGSDLTDYLIGTTLFVDGGMTLVPRIRDRRLTGCP